MPAWVTRLMPLFLAALLGGMIWLLNRAAEAPADVRVIAPDQPDLIAQAVQVQRFDVQGRLVSILKATEAKHLPQEDTMLFERPSLEQKQPGQPWMMLTGERAKTIHSGAEVWFEGDVEMRRAADANNPPLVILTSDMYVDTEKQLARSSALVTAEMGSHRARAVGFVADNRKETLELLSQVSMTYVPNKSVSSSSSSLLP